MKRMNKKGVSLAEVVIAMSVILIVTVTALSIVLSSTNASLRAARESEALYFAADAVECFRVAEDGDALIGLLNARGGADEPITDERGAFVYTMKESGYQVCVKASYDGRPTVTVTAYGDGGREITSFTYEKGVSG